jgi:hypothetical protein
MREIDRRECEAFGRTPKDALRSSLRTSFQAFTAMSEDRRPVAMLGVVATGLATGRAVPWLLGSEEVFNYPRDLLVLGRRTISVWLETFREMENLVASDNDKAIRLLRKWGAEIGDEPEMHGQVEFVRFTFRRGAIQGLSGAA